MKQQQHRIIDKTILFVLFKIITIASSRIDRIIDGKCRFLEYFKLKTQEYQNKNQGSYI